MDITTVPPELNFFEVPHFNAPYQKVQFVEYRSPSPLNTGGAIQFNIAPTANQFIDLRRSILHVEARIIRKDGKDLGAEDVFAPVNLPIHSCFSQVQVELQQQLVSNNQHYGYKAYLETILNSNKHATETYLLSSLFSKDSSAKIDEVIKVRENKGLLHRHIRFGKGQIVDMESPIFADFFQQTTLLLSGVELDVRLWPARDEFVILSEHPHYKFQFTEVYLRVCKITPTPPVMLAIANELKDKPALYPFTRSEIRAFQLQKKQFSFHMEDLYQQSVPTEVIACMVKATGFHGAYDANPFSFNHFNISTLGLFVDDESVPTKELQMTWGADAENYVEAYNYLFDNPPNDSGTTITRDEFNKGFTIFRFQVSPKEVQALPNPRGNVKLTGTFKAPLEDNVTLLVIGKFNHVLRIDNTRKVEL